MTHILDRTGVTRTLALAIVLWVPDSHAQDAGASLGREVAIPRHMQDGEEFQTPIPQLIEYGRALFTANWTIQEGAGRPNTKGTGTPLSDATQPLVFPRAFNRISGPDSNSCAGCHNQPYAGGGGDIVTNVFVLGQRFDFAEFDDAGRVRTKSSLDERGQRTNLDNIADSRMTLGMFGAGYIEMLARQMTADLQAIRDATPPGGSRQPVSKGVHFGKIARSADGQWDVSRVEGLPAVSLVTRDPHMPPSLVIRPFHQAGRVVSIREFSNNAFNQHHGMQSEERFGAGKDPDGDGVANELTRADLTAVTIFQATLPVPVEVVPKDAVVRKAAEEGRRQFAAIGCATCHIPALPLDRRGWIFTEPDPYNPPSNLRPGEAPTLAVDLSAKDLPQPRLKPDANGVVWVPAFTDLKLHDITAGPGDPNVEPLDMQQEPGTPAFYATNSKFLTRRLGRRSNLRRDSSASPQWARIASRMVTLEDGSNGTAYTTFNVVGPTGSMGVRAPGSVTVDSTCDGQLEAHYGCPSGTEGTYSTPAGYSGSYQWIQTISTSLSETTTSGTVKYWRLPGGSSPCAGLDTTYPYDTASQTDDSPDTPLLTGYQASQRSDNFTMTLMFQPSGVGTAIWVPISSVGWGWSYSASSSNNGSSWTLNSSSNAGSPSASATTSFPSWTYNWTSCTYN